MNIPALSRYTATSPGKPRLGREMHGATLAGCSGYQNTRNAAEKLGCSGVAAADRGEPTANGPPAWQPASEPWKDYRNG